MPVVSTPGRPPLVAMLIESNDRDRTPRLGVRCALALALAAGGCVTDVENMAFATPQRPSLSADTSTTAPGTFELEAGLAWDPGDRFDSPVAIKYGSGPATEVFLLAAPVVIVDESGPGEESGFGDMGVGIRHRFLEETDARPSAAIQAQLKLPTADEDKGLGTGELDAGFAGIVTQSFDPVTFTGFYELGLVGDPGGNTNIAHSIAAAGSLPLEGSLAGLAEIAGVFQPEESFDSIFTTWGLTYAMSRALVVDAAIVVGLSDDAPDFAMLVGFTQNFGDVVRSAFGRTASTP